ncbi:MAG: hypothetical protein OEV62_00150 [Actinomycetota bacterium]|nr:hypothetical protein [Actinomycetota bacterium]
MPGRTTPKKQAPSGFDLDAVARDADGAAFEFTFGGQGWELPANPDMRAVDELTRDPMAGLSRLLGDQWADFEALPQVFGAREFAALLEAYQSHLGVVNAGG